MRLEEIARRIKNGICPFVVQQVVSKTIHQAGKSNPIIVVCAGGCHDF